MWRVCTLAITVIPATMAVLLAGFDPFSGGYSQLPQTCSHRVKRSGIFIALGALLYIPARIIILVLSITTLRHLPI